MIYSHPTYRIDINENTHYCKTKTKMTSLKFCGKMISPFFETLMTSSENVGCIQGVKQRTKNEI